MLEKEFKVLLTREKFFELEELVSILFHSKRSVIIQNNHYYDTPNMQLLHDQSTLRVREIKGRYTLQLKQHINRTGNIIYSNEYSKKINSTPDFINSTELPFKSGAVFYNIGLLKTERTSYSIQDRRFDFDKNHYFNIQDYELEVEYTNELPASIASIIWGEITPPNTVSKYERFCVALLDQHRLG